MYSQESQAQSARLNKSIMFGFGAAGASRKSFYRFRLAFSGIIWYNNIDYLSPPRKEAQSVVGTILLCVFFVLCILLLLPVRLKASFGDGKWAVAVYYAFFRVFYKESAENPKPDTPKKPLDLPDGEAPPLPEPEPTPAAKKPTPAADSVPKPTTVTEQPKAESEPESSPAPESEAPPDADTEPTQADTAEPVSKSKEKPKRRKRKKSDSPDSESDAEEDADKPTEKPKKRGFIRRLKPQSLDEGIGLLQDACAALSPALKFLTRHLHFRHIKLYLAVGSDDPANTATLYGKICAAAYNLLAALQCWVDIETDEFRILADFYNESMTFRAAAELRVSPMAAILLVLILGVKFLWRTLCRFRREDKEAKRKVKDTAPAAVSSR